MSCNHCKYTDERTYPNRIAAAPIINYLGGAYYTISVTWLNKGGEGGLEFHGMF